MSNYVNSPNMLLPIPIVSVAPGPEYASDVNASLTLVDGHNHTPGSGVQIPPAGLNINSDLTFLDNNATALRSVRFTAQGSALSTLADIGCVYEAGIDLWYNDANGVQIQITKNGSVNSATGSITGLVSPASASYNALTETFVWQSNVNTPADMDGGSFIFRNMVSNSPGLTLAPPTLGADYTLTLPPLPSATSFMRLDTAGNMTATITTDNTTIGINGSSQLYVIPGSITGANIAAHTVSVNNKVLMTTGTSVILDGFAVSASSGSFSNTSTTPATVFSVSISTSGRPVAINFQPDGSGTAGVIQSQNTGGACMFAIRRNGTVISLTTLQNVEPFPPGMLNFIDYVGASTYTYDLQAYVIPGGGGREVDVTNVKMTAYEI